MKSIFTRLKAMLCASPLLAALLTVGVAAADTGDTTNWLDNAAPDVPSYQLGGWFFNPDTQPFPAPSDPSQQWTSGANIDQINYWLSLASDLGNDSSTPADLTDSGTDDSWISSSSSQILIDTPEPMTISLLGGGLMFLGLYAAGRTRRMR